MWQFRKDEWVDEGTGIGCPLSDGRTEKSSGRQLPDADVQSATLLQELLANLIVKRQFADRRNGE
jgi:hypothetical protein